MKRQLLESQQKLDKTRKEALFNAGFSASIGFNQIANTFRDVYRNPSQREFVELTLSIPLVDWGVRKGQYNMAKSNLNIVQLTAQQDELRLEEDIIMTVGDFTMQQQMIRSAEEAVELAKVAYEQTQERFIIGKADISSLTLSTNRRQEAQRNYIAALKNYWQNSGMMILEITRLTMSRNSSNPVRSALPSMVVSVTPMTKARMRAVMTPNNGGIWMEK